MNYYLEFTMTKINPEEIWETLKKQDEEIERRRTEKPTFYIHYDAATRKVLSFRNYLETSDNNPHVIVTEENLDVPLSEFCVDNQIVLFKDNKLKIEKVEPLASNITRIDDFIYEIPKVISEKRLTYADRTFDLMIEQSNEEKIFKIKLAKTVREKYSLHSYNDQLMYVYVTAVNDPNILYKTLKFTFGDLIKHEYHTLDFEDFQGEEANIYSFRYFNDYLHVDIR